MSAALKIDGPTQLCNLPDDILHSILGLLQLNEAVRCCILSKRWQHFPTTMPELRFVQNHDHWRDRAHFISSTDKVIAKHDPSSPIRELVLSCSVLRDGHVINSWIIAAISARAQVLSLDLCSFVENDGPYILPQCIFRSDTLVELRMNLFLHSLDLPDSATISLPNLKTLRLVSIRLVSGENVRNLLSCSPLLETLSLKDCIWTNYDLLEWISSSRLRVLEILARGVDYDLPPICTACPSLEKFCYTGNLWNEVFMDGPIAKLDTAEIDLRCAENSNKKSTSNSAVTTVGNVVQLLRAVDGVKRLTFLSDIIKGFKKQPGNEDFPIFDNLVELKLSDKRTNGRLAMTILRRCPCLEKIEFMMRGRVSEDDLLPGWKEDGCSRYRDYDYDYEDDLAHCILKLEPPLCFRTLLKKITLTNFYGSDIDFQYAKKLLQICVDLEEMVVEISRWDANEVLENVRTLPKASQTCRITPKIAH